MLPLVAIFLVVHGVRELICLLRGDSPARVAWRAAAGVALVACFLGVTHSIGQILSRVGGGFAEMVSVSYQRCWYLKFFVLYVGFALILMTTRWRPFRQMLRDNAAVAAFMLLYAVAYLVCIAFYQPVSGTTARMLLAHAAPLLFVLSYLFARAPFAQARWTIAGVTFTPAHFHVLVLAMLGSDLVFVLPTRLLADFTGY